MVGVKFIFAVIHWLSHFPNAFITENDKPCVLGHPFMLFKILETLLDEDLTSAKSDPEIFNKSKKGTEFQNLSEEDQQVIRLQFDSVFYVLEKNSTNKKIDISNEYLDQINIDGLYNGDLNQINHICKLFVQVGTSSKMAAFGLTLISFLSDEDRKEIKAFMGAPENNIDADFDEIADASQEKYVSKLRKSNSQLRSQLEELKAENISLTKKLDKTEEKYSISYSDLINENDSKTDKLKYKINNYSEENKSLRRKLKEYETNYSIEDYMNLKEELKLTKQRQMKLQNENELLRKINDMKMNEKGDLTDYESKDKEYEAAILWESNLMDHLVYNLALKKILT